MQPVQWVLKGNEARPETEVFKVPRAHKGLRALREPAEKKASQGRPAATA